MRVGVAPKSTSFPYSFGWCAPSRVNVGLSFSTYSAYGVASVDPSGMALPVVTNTLCSASSEAPPQPQIPPPLCVFLTTTNWRLAAPVVLSKLTTAPLYGVKSQKLASVT